MVSFLKFILFLVLMAFSFSLGVRFSDNFKSNFKSVESVEIQVEKDIEDIAKDSEEKIEEIKDELEDNQEQNIEESIKQNLENKEENTEKAIVNDFEEPISMDGIEEGIYQEENIKTIKNDLIDNTDITETNNLNIENQSQNFDITNNKVQEIKE